MMRRTSRFKPTVVLLVMLAATVSLTTADVERLNRSQHFSLEVDDAGPRAVVLHATGERLLLNREVPLFGFGSYVGLLKGRDATTSELRIHDARGNLLWTQSIANDREVLLGERTLVLRPRALHAAISGAYLEFRQLSGEILSTFQRSESALVGIEYHVTDHWSVVTRDSVSHDSTVHLFGPDGSLRWSHPVGRPAVLLVRVSRSGERAVIGTTDSDFQRTRIELLDRSGQVLIDTKLPLLQTAAFDPTERHLALVGPTGLRLLDASNGALRWQRDQSVNLVAGESVAFSKDRPEVWLASRIGESAGSRIEVTSYPLDGSDPATLPLQFVPSRREREEGFAILALREAADGKLLVVTVRERRRLGR